VSVCVYDGMTTAAVVDRSEYKTRIDNNEYNNNYRDEPIKMGAGAYIIINSS